MLSFNRQESLDHVFVDLVAFSSVGGIVLEAKIFTGGAPIVLILTVISILINRFFLTILFISFAFFLFILFLTLSWFFLLCVFFFLLVFYFSLARRLDERLFLLSSFWFFLFFRCFLRSGSWALFIIIIIKSCGFEIFILSGCYLFCSNWEFRFCHMVISYTIVRRILGSFGKSLVRIGWLFVLIIGLAFGFSLWFSLNFLLDLLLDGRVSFCLSLSCGSDLLFGLNFSFYLGSRFSSNFLFDFGFRLNLSFSLNLLLFISFNLQLLLSFFFNFGFLLVKVRLLIFHLFDESFLFCTLLFGIDVDFGIKLKALVLLESDHRQQEQYCWLFHFLFMQDINIYNILPIIGL